MGGSASVPRCRPTTCGSMLCSSKAPRPPPGDGTGRAGAAAPASAGWSATGTTRSPTITSPRGTPRPSPPRCRRHPGPGPIDRSPAPALRRGRHAEENGWCRDYLFYTRGSRHVLRLFGPDLTFRWLQLGDTLGRKLGVVDRWNLVLEAWK